jgi:hypothetical protein
MRLSDVDNVGLCLDSNKGQGFKGIGSCRA